MSTFVSVGNATQPFRRLLDAVCDRARQLPQPVLVQYGAMADFSCPDCRGVAFMHMQEFEQELAQAELLILHAGAGSVIHAVRAGKVPVVMPRRMRLGEHVDDHQLELAGELAVAGRIVVCEDPNDLLRSAEMALGRQRTPVASRPESALLGLVRGVIVQHAKRLDSW